MVTMGLDIGSNSVGGAWWEVGGDRLTSSTSIFPAGVEESEDKRGDPKNAKRRQTRRARITLARRAQRKREFRLKLIGVGLLPKMHECETCARRDQSDRDGTCCFRRLLETTDPWELRRGGLQRRLAPYEFGRVLLHLAQRRGAAGLDPDADDDGKVKAAIVGVQFAMLDRYSADEDKVNASKLRKTIEELGKKKRRNDDDNAQLDAAHENLKGLCRNLLRQGTVTFGRFIADVRDQRRIDITTPDKRKEKRGPREWRNPVRNRAGRYEFCADRSMIRDEFAKLWDAQKKLGGPLANLLTDELRRALDDESGDSTWRHKGLLFGQRRASWDLGTLGRCNLHPEERCVPHADMYASRYLVVETVNNLRIIQRGMPERALTQEERKKIKDYLSRPLGAEKSGKRKGEARRTVSVTDLRELMGWGRATKTTQYRFNIETDEDRTINTDWFSREIIHGAIGLDRWAALPESAREGINRALLKFDPTDEGHAAKLKGLVMQAWAGLDDAQAHALVAAWKKRPKVEKRLNLSRRAVRNMLALMDRPEPWPDANRPGEHRWLTQIEARKLIAEDAEFQDAATGQPLDDHTRRRYATGAKGATARDRHYMKKHLLKKDGQVIYGPDGLPLHEPPPAPMITNPVVRKAIHEVRRHLIEYMTTFGRKPDRVHIELSREAQMGKKDADEALLRNRLRNRISRDILREYKGDSLTPTQQREAVRRVVLCLQQGGRCPLCGNQVVRDSITPHMAFKGQDCEIAHIIPSGAGGDNRWSNLVLAHTRCNRDMGRQTPRQFWEKGAGFDTGIGWVESIYSEVERPKGSEIKSASEEALWCCYFSRRDDKAKIEQFKKDIKDIQDMTARQDAATKYATRQVMSYLADALYDGKGLPERSTGSTDGASRERRIFAVHKRWTGRLRREWGLFFDPHGRRDKQLSEADRHARQEKDRGDHRHHAVDAAAIALWSPELERVWDDREKRAERDGINTADEEAMDRYRRDHPLPVPPPFQTREALREAVRRAVFGDEGEQKPICHRPVKRRLVGYLHKETLFGPVLDRAGQLTGKFTARPLGGILELEPNHLRLPRPETKDEAIDRLSARRMADLGIDERAARKWARALVDSPGWTPRVIDPTPGKSGLVRDVVLRRRLRECLAEAEPPVDPDNFTAAELKRVVAAGGMKQASGVPINSFVLLRAMSDPVITSRRSHDYATGKRCLLYDAATNTGDLRAARAYDGQNNHHIEIRVAKKKDGTEEWSGKVISAFEAAQRNLARQRAFRKAGIPTGRALRALPKDERAKLKPLLREAEQSHPIVDRSDNADGRFVMSLCEGETLWMKHKETGEVGYFVVAKLDKPNGIVLVAHWDARPATGRKDVEGKKVANSKREDFTIRPGDLPALAPPDRPHAIKVRVSPLGKVTELRND